MENEFLLWPEGAPFARGEGREDQPSITIFRPEKPNGASVVICPGGGYFLRSEDHEGAVPARWLNALGITAFVLLYRVVPYSHPCPMLDGLRAVRTVRTRAAEWGLDPNRIGIWGFSAGAHLAGTVSTHFDSGDLASADPVERVSSRPDFCVLSYPVVTMYPEFAHMGSRINLIGENPTPELIEDMSLEKRVTTATPPTFLFHTDADDGVPAENSINFYLALRRAGVPAEMHIYEQGAHGLGLAENDPVLGTWSSRLADWLAGKGMC